LSWPPDRYDGTLVPPAAPAGSAGRTSCGPEEPSTADSIAAAIEELYEREPKLTRNLLDLLRSASIADLERLFR
jgi:hypothetical protein